MCHSAHNTPFLGLDNDINQWKEIILYHEVERRAKDDRNGEVWHVKDYM